MPDLDMGAPFDVVFYTTANQDVSSDRIYISKDGPEEIWWKGDEPSHKTAWKEVGGEHLPCTFHLGFGFMTQDELWKQRQLYPRDSL